LAYLRARDLAIATLIICRCREVHRVLGDQVFLGVLSSIDTIDVTSEHVAMSEAHFKRAAEYFQGSWRFDSNDEDILPGLKEFVYLKCISEPETFAIGSQSTSELLKIP
jgi:hypothetical protein